METALNLCDLYSGRLNVILRPSAAVTLWNANSVELWLESDISQRKFVRVPQVLIDVCHQLAVGYRLTGLAT
jgi:hypothetical protein